MMVGFALLFTLLLPAASSSWVEVGKKNIAMLREMNTVSQSIKGKQITPDLMKEMNDKMQSYFAPKISCNGVKRSTIGIHLKDTSSAECLQAFGQMFATAGMQVEDFEQKNLAIDTSSGGYTILTYQPSDLVGTTMGGEVVPGTKVEGAITNFMYKFNEESLVTEMTMDFDTGIMNDITRMVQTYSAAQARGVVMDSMIGGGSWSEVGKRNVETLRTMNELFADMTGKQITPILMKKISESVQSYYAPRLSCMSAKKSGMSVHLIDATPHDCFQAIASAWGNVKVLDFVVRDFGIDPASGGKNILTYQLADFVGVTPSGQEVPNTLMKGLTMNYRYKFNEKGLITHMEQEFDSGILHTVSMNVLAFGRSARQGHAVSEELLAEAGSSWEQVGQRNIATLQRSDEITQELKGKHVTPAILAKLAKQSMAFFAPKMSCVAASQSDMRLHLVDVTPGECFQAIGQRWGNTKVIDIVDKHLSVDPSTGGNTVLSRISCDLVGVTSMGQSVPGSDLKGMVINMRYKFNSDGLMDYFEQNFDSAILGGLNAKVSQSQADESLMESPLQKMYGHQSLSGAISLFAGGAVCSFTVVALMSTVSWARQKVQRPESLKVAFLDPAC